jgi:Wall-associated receptor kinase galacturonan-binding
MIVVQINVLGGLGEGVNRFYYYISFTQEAKQKLMAMILLQVLLILLAQSVESAPNALHGCPDNCGAISIPYPFGIGSNCSMEGFELSCNTTHNGKPTPYLFNTDILNISLSLGQARVSSPISSRCYNSTSPSNYTDSWWTVDFDGFPFRFNHEKNKFVVIGCDTLAYINLTNDQNSYLGGCVLACVSPESLTDGPCSGIGCCQTTIPKGTNVIDVSFGSQEFNNSEVHSFSPCSYAVLMEDEGFMFETSYITTKKLYDQNRTLVLDWAIGNTTCEIATANKASYACKSSNSCCLNSTSGPGYICNCSPGYQGNPYLEGGCQGLSCSIYLSETHYCNKYLRLINYLTCVMQTLMNVQTKIHAPGPESVTIFKEDTDALVLSAGAVTMTIHANLTCHLL